MRKRRELIEGVFYHVTSRTNNKICVFNNRLGRKIMLVILEAAKEKYNFKLDNFCIMPNHIHLLIKPAEGTGLSRIIQWIKTRTAKSWNFSNNTTDHLWGERYFSRIIRNQQEYDAVMDYIDQNPVVAGLVSTPTEWLLSGAFYRANGINSLIDY